MNRCTLTEKHHRLPIKTKVNTYAKNHFASMPGECERLEKLSVIQLWPIHTTEPSLDSISQLSSFKLNYCKNKRNSRLNDEKSESTRKDSFTSTYIEKLIWQREIIENSHRLVRVLQRIRKPHCRQRTGSPPLMTLRAPQSPHRYSTPRMIGMGAVDVASSAGVALPAGVFISITITPLVGYT